MRVKTERLIITFHTTSEAIALEKACAAESLPGRLIPVPRQISSGCGLSWSTEPDRKECMEEFMNINKIGFEAMGVYLI